MMVLMFSAVCHMRNNSSEHFTFCGNSSLLETISSADPPKQEVPCCQITIYDESFDKRLCECVTFLLSDLFPAITTCLGNFDSNSTTSSTKWILTHSTQHTPTSLRSRRDGWERRYIQSRIYWEVKGFFTCWAPRSTFKTNDTVTNKSGHITERCKAYHSKHQI